MITIQFQASTLDNRNVGSKVTIPKKDRLVFGQIASIERRTDVRKVVLFLTDGAAEHEVDFDTWLDLQLSAAENATIQASAHIQRIAELVDRAINRKDA